MNLFFTNASLESCNFFDCYSYVQKRFQPLYSFNFSTDNFYIENGGLNPKTYINSPTSYLNPSMVNIFMRQTVLHKNVLNIQYYRKNIKPPFQEFTPIRKYYRLNTIQTPSLYSFIYIPVFLTTLPLLLSILL